MKKMGRFVSLVLLAGVLLAGFFSSALAETKEQIETLDAESVRDCIATSRALEQGDRELGVFRQRIEATDQSLREVRIKIQEDRVYLEQAEGRYVNCMKNTQGFEPDLIEKFCGPYESTYNSEFSAQNRRAQSFLNRTRRLERDMENYNQSASELQALVQEYYTSCVQKDLPERLYWQYCVGISTNFCESFRNS